MCLVAKFTQARKAVRDIYAIKAFSVVTARGSFRTPYRDFLMRSNKKYTTTMVVTSETDRVLVHQGFHAYVNTEASFKWFIESFSYCSFSVVKISKGSIFMIGSHGDIVATSMRVVKGVDRMKLPKENTALKVWKDSAIVLDFPPAVIDTVNDYKIGHLGKKIAKKIR